MLDDLLARLRYAGLRATRYRVLLARLLFTNGDRHVTAELLFNEAAEASVPTSLATVYNTLNQFTQAGMLRKVAPDGARTFFDTNLGDHHHLFAKDTGMLIDIPGSGLILEAVPKAPAGLEISRIDAIVTLRRSAGRESVPPARAKPA